MVFDKGDVIRIKADKSRVGATLSVVGLSLNAPQQVGNYVCAPVIKRIAEKMKETLE